MIINDDYIIQIFFYKKDNSYILKINELKEWLLDVKPIFNETDKKYI